MFIKIKLEPQSSKALSPLKKISYFSINENATIIDLKIKIEGYVDVPAERQEIRTLIAIFENGSYVKDVCDVRGTAIMLYENHELGESQFVCFLQVYTNELAAQQQEHEQRSKHTIDKDNTNTSTSTSSVTLIADSETDRETDTETSSASDVENGGSTDNSDSTFRKKRSKNEGNYTLQNKKLKVTTSSEVQYPKALCQYLDEFPKFSKLMKSTVENTTNEFGSSCKSTECDKSNETGEKLNQSENLKNSFEIKPTNTDLPKIQSNTVTTTINKENKKSVHPCYSISPEIRDFLVIICPNDGSRLSDIEFEDLLVWFFDQFRTCDLSNNLQFDIKTAISLFDGKLWIACMNVNTFEWIAAIICKYSLKSYKILPLKAAKHMCEVILPMVSSTKNILDIFDLLERQNKNTKTLKWSLHGRQPLSVEDDDFNEKAVSTFCTNELFKISMDSESKTNLEKVNFTLKYCFWQIVLKFI